MMASTVKMATTVYERGIGGGAIADIIISFALVKFYAFAILYVLIVMQIKLVVVVVVVVGVLVGVAAIIVTIVIVVKFCNKKKVPKTNLPVVLPVPTSVPSSMVYSPPPQPSEPDVAMQPFAPGAVTQPPRYEGTVVGEAQPSAPPYNPYYKGSFRYI